MTFSIIIIFFFYIPFFHIFIYFNIYFDAHFLYQHTEMSYGTFLQQLQKKIMAFELEYHRPVLRTQWMKKKKNYWHSTRSECRRELAHNQHHE